MKSKFIAACIVDTYLGEKTVSKEVSDWGKKKSLFNKMYISTLSNYFFFFFFFCKTIIFIGAAKHFGWFRSFLLELN